MTSIVLMLFVFDAKATVYTSIADGNYNNCAIWDVGCPNNTIQNGDTVIINHVISASSSMNIKGVLEINPSGSFSNTNTIDVNALGVVSNDGYFSTLGELHLDGYFFNSSVSAIQDLHVDGYVCNTGTIQVSDETFIHGGIIECNGTLNTCELDMDNNNASEPVTGSSSSFLQGQDICCNANSSNPLDDLSADWLIDSSSVSICGLPLIPNAGDDANLSICNSVDSEINLNDLLSLNTGGVFTELTSSGSFDALTGILNANGLASGNYVFEYTAQGYNNTSDVAEFTITVSAELFSEETIAVCENEIPFEWNGTTISESGSVSVMLSSSVSGCDSTVTLNLIVNTIPTSMNDTLVCGSQLPFSWNGSTISGPGSETVTLTSSNGCDSVAVLNVSIEQLEVPVVDFSGPVSCPKDLVTFSILNENSDAVYEWNGPNGFVSSEIFNEFELTEDLMGTYEVNYSLNSCISETTFIDLEIENIFEYKTFKFPNVITANGDDVNDKIILEDFLGSCTEFELTIRDRWGSEVFRQNRGEESFQGLSIDGTDLPEGTYFYRLTFAQGDVSGFMHIIR
ncbi:MAG: gliding motility-associated C-terminal domain-containing protein [Crocinitomicaceae bacterium]|nr:gliding motility-associated C-terminal domain-containing protein [Crocinitomicaceae bacterium]